MKLHVTEEMLHRTVARFLSLALRSPTIWTSIDAGAGKMSRAAAGRRKARGVKAGWPDILVMHPVARAGNNYGCWMLGIELKTAKGRLSPEQKAVAQAFEQAGGFAFVARSVDEVEWYLLDFGIPLFAKMNGDAA